MHKNVRICNKLGPPNAAIKNVRSIWPKTENIQTPQIAFACYKIELLLK